MSLGDNGNQQPKTKEDEYAIHLHDAVQYTAEYAIDRLAKISKNS